MSLIGPSGCGKSTLMLITAGLVPASTGELVVGGEVLQRPLTDVGIVFQDHLLLEFRSALDNVLLQAQIRRLPLAARPRGGMRASWASSAFPSPPATAIRANCPAACGSACRSRAP